MHKATVEAMPAEKSTAVVVAVQRAKVAVAAVATSVPPRPVTKTMPTATVEATLAEKGARHRRCDQRACRCRRLCRQSV
jgi:hypothetical protein